MYGEEMHARETAPRNPAHVRVAAVSAPQYRCGSCRQPMPNYGRRLQMVAGVRTWVGRCCVRRGGE